jgi:hypothetical protein
LSSSPPRLTPALALAYQRLICSLEAEANSGI